MRKKVVVALVIVLLIIVGITLIFYFKGSNSQQPTNKVVYGNVLAKSDNSLVIEQDPVTVGEQPYLVFSVNADTVIYGMKGMTQVALDEIVPEMYVRIVYSSSDSINGLIATEIKVQIKDFAN